MGLSQAIDFFAFIYRAYILRISCVHSMDFSEALRFEAHARSASLLRELTRALSGAGTVGPPSRDMFVVRINSLKQAPHKHLPFALF